MFDIKIRIISLLRWSEKYTKTDMVYVAKGSSWTIFGSIISVGLSAATLLAFANWLPKESYGTYQYVLSIIGILGITTLGGMGTAIARAAARGKDGSLFDALREKVKWGFLGGLGSILLGAYYLFQGNDVLGWAFVGAGLFIPFWEAPGIYSNYLQGKKRFDLINIADTIIQLCLVLVLVPALFLTDNILIILFLYILVLGLGRAVALLFSLQKLPPNTEEDTEVVSYGRHLSAMSVVGTIASSVDKVLLWHLLGPVPVAVYTFAQSIPARANGFLKIINRLAFPKMAAQEPGILRQTLMRKVLFLTAFSTLGAFAYVAVAPFIFSFFLPQYVEAVPYTMLASVLIALQPFSLISSSFSAQAKKRLLYIWNIGAPVMRIMLFLTLIPLWGLWGAMIGLVTAKALESLLLIVLFYR